MCKKHERPSMPAQCASRRVTFRTGREVNRTQPGYLKILPFFLVDPQMPAFYTRQSIAGIRSEAVVSRGLSATSNTAHSDMLYPFSSAGTLSSLDVNYEELARCQMSVSQIEKDWVDRVRTRWRLDALSSRLTAATLPQNSPPHSSCGGGLSEGWTLVALVLIRWASTLN